MPEVRKSAHARYKHAVATATCQDSTGNMHAAMESWKIACDTAPDLPDAPLHLAGVAERASARQQSAPTSTILLSSGGQLIRIGVVPEIPRLTCMTVGGSKNVPQA